MTCADMAAAVEAAFKTGCSTSIELGERTLARIVASSRRGNRIVPSRDSLRSPEILKRWLRTDDVVIEQRGEPIAVLVSIEEYNRLTGRRPKQETP